MAQHFLEPIHRDGMHRIKRRIGPGSGLGRRHFGPSQCESCFIGSLTTTSREHSTRQQRGHLSILPPPRIPNCIM